MPKTHRIFGMDQCNGGAAAMGDRHLSGLPEHSPGSATSATAAWLGLTARAALSNLRPPSLFPTPPVDTYVVAEHSGQMVSLGIAGVSASGRCLWADPAAAHGFRCRDQ